MPPLLFWNRMGMILNVYPRQRVMKMKLKACPGMHLVHCLQLVAEINVCGYGKFCQGMSMSVFLCLQGHTQDVKMVQWHPTVDVLFSCSYDNTIKVWVADGDSDDWHCVQTLGKSNRYWLNPFARL